MSAVTPYQWVEETCTGTGTGPDLPAVGTEVTYLGAIKAALLHALRTDPRVAIIGEDVGIMGGAFRITDGFLTEFGEDRIVDMPIAEAAIIGAGIGMAVRGARPVVEMQFSDFLASGWNQLVNNAGTFHYRSGQAVPMVVRLPSGGGMGAGPFHSGNLEALLAHTPGLKVVVPSSVEDAWGLLLSALEDPDPVMFCEQKLLYRRLKGSLPERTHRVPLGEARVVREGSDLTVVTWGSFVGLAEEAAAALADEGCSVEVIDLRSIVPWDRDAVLRSVRKTSRVVLAHEARRRVGFGAEIAAEIAESAFEWLDAPVRRVAALNTPCPSHPALEAVFRPDLDALVRGLRETWRY